MILCKNKAWKNINAITKNHAADEFSLIPEKYKRNGE
jgi:hypothetical protein